jgi:tetrahydromethanopterin S-methyltransferase subunit G
MSGDLTKKLPKSDSETLNLILTTVQSLDNRSVLVEARFGTVEARLERVEIRMENVSSRLQRLEQKVELRRYDTRPLWHKVVADIAQLHAGQQRLGESQTIFNDAIRKVHVDFHDIDERLKRLEINRNEQNSST